MCPMVSNSTMCALIRELFLRTRPVGPELGEDDSEAMARSSRKGAARLCRKVEGEDGGEYGMSQMQMGNGTVRIWRVMSYTWRRRHGVKGGNGNFCLKAEAAPTSFPLGFELWL